MTEAIFFLLGFGIATLAYKSEAERTLAEANKVLDRALAANLKAQAYHDRAEAMHKYVKENYHV